MIPGAYFHPDAEEELLEAVAFYEQERSGLGADFLNETTRSLEFAIRFPEAAPTVRTIYRSLVVSRFPFSLIYRPMAEGRIRILAIAHHKRRPGYWRDRREDGRGSVGSR